MYGKGRGGMAINKAKILGAAITVVILFFLAACGKTEAQNADSANDFVPPAASRMAAITAADLVREMKLGWNLGNTMDVSDSSKLRLSAPSGWETGWGNPVTTPELFAVLYEKGFNVFRIPVSWSDHLMLNEDWKIVDSWMDRVQEIVDYAHQTGAYVILNTHHESWLETYYDNQERGARIYRRVWSQIAERFADYDERLLFEGMNEPRKKGTSVEWNGGDQEGWDVINFFNGVFVETIRNSGGNNPDRVLLITPYAANGWEAVKHLAVPDDDEKLIVSVHAYEPYEFALKINGRGNWNEDKRAIDELMGGLNDLFISKGIPVIMGEFGAMYKPAEGNEADRGAWAEYYTGKARELGIPCVWWDNGEFSGDGELFGLIDREKLAFVFPLILDGLLRGAGVAE
jgi:endoglucanase